MHENRVVESSMRASVSRDPLAACGATRMSRIEDRTSGTRAHRMRVAQSRFEFLRQNPAAEREKLGDQNVRPRPSQRVDAGSSRRASR